MKFTDSINLSFKNIKSSKFKSLTYILIFTIIMTIITCMFSGKTSLLNFFDDYKNNDFHYRTIGLQLENFDNNIKDKIVKSNISHISTIFESSNAFHQIVNYGENGYIELYGDYDGISYTLDLGKKIENDNEIICPSTFLPDNWTEKHNINDYSNLGDKLDKDIEIKYYQYYIIDENNSNVLKSFNRKLKLVGTFNPKKDLVGYNVCYVSPNTFETIAHEKHNLYSDYMKKQLTNTEIFILVDKYENVNYVMKELSKLNYKPELYYDLDVDFFNDILKIINIITKVIVIITIFCSYLFIKNTITDNQKNIALYRLIGYDAKTLYKIFLYQYIICIFISFFGSIILSNSIRLIVLLFLSNDPNYNILNICMCYNELLVYLLIIMLTNIFSLYISINKNKSWNKPLTFMEV